MKAKRKWSSLDIIILVVVFVAIIVFFNRHQIFKPNTTDSGANGVVSVYYEAEAGKYTEDNLRGFKIGDQIVSQNKFQEGFIEKIEIRNTPKTIVNAAGELVTYEDEQEKTIVVGIRGEANKYGPYMEIGGQALKVGGSYYIKTNVAEVFGKVKYIEVTK